MFAANEPIKIAGNSRGPKIRREAIAMPVGGQTAVTFVCAEANDNPNSAAPKYVTATSRFRTIKREGFGVVVDVIISVSVLPTA